MSDEANPQSDVNQESLPESSTESAPEVNSATPPAEENSAQTKAPEEKAVPYSRFKEVIDTKNQYETKLKELELRLTNQELKANAQKISDKTSKAAEKLMRAGVDPQVAELLTSAMAEVAEERVDQRVTPVEQLSVKREIDSWVEDFSSSHKDYNQIRPEMEKVFASLPETMKSLVVAHPLGLEMLYRHVKGVQAEQNVEKAKQEGRNEAYSNQQLKSAVSSSPSSAPTPKPNLTEEDINKMPLAEYKKLREKLFSDPSLLAKLSESIRD